MTKRSTFHHGSLREALIEAAHLALNEKGVEYLSLRELAATAGVSASAPYRHFKNKEALLQALIDEAANNLTIAYRKAARLDASSEVRLRSACNAYLDFAQARPGLYCLLFEGDGTKAPEDFVDTDHDPAFGLFVKLVSATTTVLDNERALEAAFAAWSLLHGFASLKIHQCLPQGVSEAKLRERIVDAAIAVPAKLSA